ncbi:MAG: hypothetical protein H6922_05615 [Pseudomonadaceae bacterium]|nr:hypothetical protein [Pseudomonadaceae bacterium]
MTIEETAILYVDYIEPAIKIGAFFVLVVVVLHMLNIVRHGQSPGGLVARLFEKIVAGVKYIADLLKKALLLLLHGVVAFINVIINTVRDFFTAKF